MDIRKIFVFAILFLALITACGGRPSIKIPKPDTDITINQVSSGSSGSQSSGTGSDTNEVECSGSHEIILQNKTGVDIEYVAFQYPGKSEFTRMTDDTTILPADGEVSFLVAAGTYVILVSKCHIAAADCEDSFELTIENVVVCNADVTLEVEKEEEG